MEIDLLYVPNCPNHAIVRDRVKLALDRVGLGAVVREREVESSEEAERLGMHGSPTILINGQDPFLATTGPVGLSCRLYPGERGLSGAPTVDEIVEALAREPAVPGPASEARPQH